MSCSLQIYFPDLAATAVCEADAPAVPAALSPAVHTVLPAAAQLDLQVFNWYLLGQLLQQLLLLEIMIRISSYCSLIIA